MTPAPLQVSAWIGITKGCELPVPALPSPKVHDSKPNPGHQATRNLVLEEPMGFHKHLAPDVRSRQGEGGRETGCPPGVCPGWPAGRVWQGDSCQAVAFNAHAADACCVREGGSAEGGVRASPFPDPGGPAGRGDGEQEGVINIRWKEEGRGFIFSQLLRACPGLGTVGAGWTGWTEPAVAKLRALK